MDDDGIAALGKLWHMDCFKCEECDTPFREQKYYERKGHVYCKEVGPIADCRLPPLWFWSSCVWC